MVSKFFVHLRAQWAGFLALFLVIAGGTAYAANTIGSDDIINGQVKSADIGTGQVQWIDVKNESLTGADIQDRSGVDTCLSASRVGSLCFRAENQNRTWDQALNHCANLDMRVPSLGEAIQLANIHDLPNVDESEKFWTSDQYPSASGLMIADAGSDHGYAGSYPLGESGVETACVANPIN